MYVMLVIPVQRLLVSFNVVSGGGTPTEAISSCLGSYTSIIELELWPDGCLNHSITYLGTLSDRTN
jgi:hypothetical protein